MSTRGLVGFTVDDVPKMTYNHHDSYPTELGVTTLTFIRNALDGRDALANRVRNLKCIDGKTPPTDVDKANLRRFTNLSVGNQSLDDWYCLLRETQGSLPAILDAGYMLTENDPETGLPAFGFDSLFCEWGYNIDLDADCFEVYRGFRNEPPKYGLWAKHPDVLRDGYYGITRIALMPFYSFSTWSDEEIFDWAKNVETYIDTMEAEHA